MAREPGSDNPPADAISVDESAPVPVAKMPSKASMLLELLGRNGGASLDQMIAATGWQPHTTRAALTGFRKKGHAITSEKTDRVRVYRLAQAAAQ
jgi:DNA-binding transcriptional regulator PaaX